MGKLFDSLNSDVSRRAFVGTGALATASAALAGMTARDAYAAEMEEADAEPMADGPVATLRDAEFQPDAAGEWKSVACWTNCGGKCMNQCYVEDNIVLRQKTDDTHEDSYDYPQMRGCLRGRSLRTTVFGEDRIKYPMKRKHWELGGGDKSLRGADEWERISWEEALDLAAQAIQKAREDYGPTSIFAPYYSGLYLPGARALEALVQSGGYTDVFDTASFGNYALFASPVGMNFSGLITDTATAGLNDRFDLLNADAVVLLGCNPAWATMGIPVYNLLRAKEAGLKFVCVSPDYNVSGDLYDAKWIQVRPGTDIAFLMGVAYAMLQKDSEMSLIDWDFLHAYTVGFDEESMPEGVDPSLAFVHYLQGDIDGQPKTPEWASEHCGASVEDIEWYAELMSKDNNLWIISAPAPARCNNAEDFPQMHLTVGCMGGHLGKPGNATGCHWHTFATNSGPYLLSYGNSQDIYTDTALPSYYANDLWQDVLDHKMHVAFTTDVVDCQPGAMISTFRNVMQTVPGTNLAVQAMKEWDFVLSLSIWPDMTAQYSDIILPVCTQWEQENLYFYQSHRNREIQIFPNKIIEPMYEARTDTWVGRELAARFGLDPDAVYPISTEQALFNFSTSTYIMGDDGQTYENLVQVTQDDLDEWGEKWGVVGELQDGRISLHDVFEQGIYQIERHPGDAHGFISYADFIADPLANPLPTETGKWEIYSTAKQLYPALMGVGMIEPYPTYTPALNGYEQTYADWDNKVKGDYPYQVFNPHYPRRSHTGFDNVPVLREALVSPAIISSVDAAEKGIANGDVIRIWNEWGSIIRPALVTGRMMPGVVGVPHGACPSYDADGNDVAGGDNILCAPQQTAGCASAYNTNIVNFEKYEGDFAWDVDRPLVVLTAEGEEM